MLDGDAGLPAVAGVHFRPGSSVPPKIRIDLTSAASFAGMETPERRFLDARGLFPMANVTLFAGDGGTGKSLLAMQLAAGVALTGLWLGQWVKRGSVLYFSAEDDEAETHIRLKEIAASEGFDLGQCAKLHIAFMAGKDAVLASSAKDGMIRRTKLAVALDEAITRVKPVAVILDNSADIYAGDENVRPQVRQFVGLLRSLAIRHDIALILLSHPSLSGISNGSGTSGSTAWSNTVRSRLFFQRLIETDGGRSIEPDPDARVLRTMKANYGRVGGEIAVRWEAGRFVTIGEPQVAGADFGAASRAERVFKHLLRWHLQNNMDVSPNKSSTWAPSVFAKHVQAEGIKARQFDIAMQTLLEDGQIVVTVHGPASRRRKGLDFASTAATSRASPADRTTSA